jgi:hypothetical protein
VTGRAAIIEQLGEPLFLEDFGLEGIVFFILADGTEAELFFGRKSGLHQIHDVGPYVTLLDKEGVLAGAEFHWREPDRASQSKALRRLLFWFWHDLSHFIAAVGRGQLWWAYGQLEALRGLCVNLIRIEQNVGSRRGLREAGSGDFDEAAVSSAVDLLSDGASRPAPSRGRHRRRLPETGPRHGVGVPTDLPHRARTADVHPSRQAGPRLTLIR